MWAIFDSSWNRNRYSTNAVVARRRDTDFPLLNTPIAEPEIVQIILEEAIFHVLSWKYFKNANKFASLVRIAFFFSLFFLGVFFIKYIYSYTTFTPFQIMKLKNKIQHLNIFIKHQSSTSRSVFLCTTKCQIYMSIKIKFAVIQNKNK